MSLRACFAYVNRDKEEWTIEGLLESEYIPRCCDMGEKTDEDSDIAEALEDIPEIYTFNYINGNNNREAELVFCSKENLGIERAYVENPECTFDNPAYDRDSSMEEVVYEVRKEELIRCKSTNLDDDNDYYVFSKLLKEDISYRVGDMDVYVKYENIDSPIVIKVHIFSPDHESYLNMITELSEMSVSLIKSWDDTRILTSTDKEHAEKSITEDSANPMGLKRYIFNPEDASDFLAKLDYRISLLQNHAETDLRQIYKKMPIRKAKHLTPRTLVEYNSTMNPKVNVLTTEEHYDIYEHRMIRQYLLNLKDYFQRKIQASQHKVEGYNGKIEGITNNKNEVSDSLREIFKNDYSGIKEKKEKEIKESLNKSIEKYEQSIENEKNIQRKWNEQIEVVDKLIKKYAILHVELHGETLRSSMLFLRNRYYRSVYEIIKSVPMVNVYKDINAMPTQKLYTLYEEWCYFKIVDVIIETYGFGIYSFSTVQGQLNKENTKYNESLRMNIQGMISDNSYRAGSYMCIVLKKKPEEGMKDDTDKQYVKIEYQKEFGEVIGKKLIPDFCLTFGKKIEKEKDVFDIDGQTYILDAKYKWYHDKFSILHEMFSVSLYKYILKIQDISGVNIEGSFILHPDCRKKSLSIEYITCEKNGNKTECYGADVEDLYNNYLEYAVDEDLKAVSAEKELMDEAFKNLEFKLYRNKIGCFYFAPNKDNNDNAENIRRLFRMIFEWKSPFEFNIVNNTGWKRRYSDEVHLLVWNKCLLCGGKINNVDPNMNTESDIIKGVTQGGYMKYHITCKQCGEFWVKSHCYFCHSDLIKHSVDHNYYVQNGLWFVKCPACGH